MRMFGHIVTFVAALAVATHAFAQRAEVVEVDDANPRHVVFDHPVIEFISIEPRAEVRAVGDRARPPASDLATLTVHLRNAADHVKSVRLRLIGGEPMLQPFRLQPGEVMTIERQYAVGEVPYNAVILLESERDDGAFIECDRAPVHAPDALRVGLLIETETLRAGDARFGSFVRRMRKSLEDFHAFLDDTTSTIEGERRDPIRDRFRIEYVMRYERDHLPLVFWDHPHIDLMIACDEGGPLGGFYLPAYSIGHNFLHRGTKRGLWSRWGEQALWHEALHFRGVPDYYIYPIPAGALPGRTESRIDLPARYRNDIMNDTYREDPRIGVLTAMVVNSKHAVARVGACEETDHDFGHMWRWIPAGLVIEVVEGERGDEPMRDAIVRLYRSRPAGLPDGRVQGVAADQAPDWAESTNADGRISLEGEYLGPLDAPRHQRSLWLLVEVEHRGERRLAIIWTLELNERFGRGEREQAVNTLRWEEMTPAGAEE